MEVDDQVAPGGASRDGISGASRGPRRRIPLSGRTSLSYFRLDDPPAAQHHETDRQESGRRRDSRPDATPILEGAELDRESVRSVIRELAEGGDPFIEASHPAEITRDAKLVAAHDRGDGSILMSFAVQRSVGQVIRNFSAEPVIADDFFNAVLFPDSGLVEVHAGQQVSARFDRSWLKRFTGQFDELVSYPVSITLDDFMALKDELDAGLVQYRGKATMGGSVDTLEVRISPAHADLHGQADFNAYSQGLEQQLGDLAFEEGDQMYRIRVSIIQGSIFFVTPAPEQAVVRVREALRKIKVRHRQKT